MAGSRGATARAGTARTRPATRERRREQLIRATVDSIARRGFAETTLANVADGAGLSRGIVNFHFKSKEALLAQTLEYLSEEYGAVWRGALERAENSPAQRLEALVMADFEPSVCNRRKIAVWFAFWGESKSRPTYLRTCGARDQQHHEALRGVCQAVIDDGGYDHVDADGAATVISATTDGLWLDLLLSPRSFSRERGLALTRTLLASLFPRHFCGTAPAAG